MKLVQAILLRAIAAGLVLMGLLLLIFRVSELYEVIVAYLPDSAMLRILIGAAVMALGILSLWPFGAMRARGRRIEFQDRHGSTTFQLDTVEASLAKQMARLPGVRKPVIRLEPDEAGQRVQVKAEMTLIKAAGESARELTQRVTEAISSQVKSILGVDEVTGIDLEVRDIQVEGEGAAAAVAAQPV
jgi:uncharacterized alkaline shock family protein YloU